MNLSNVCIIFVCHPGDLEIKALLLAASLREHWGDTPELIASIPKPTSVWGELAEDVASALRTLGVDIQECENPWRKDYPIGNKVASASAYSDRSIRFLFDTDILCCGNADLAWPEFAQFAAKPADFATWGRNERDWKAAYRLVGAPPPERRVLSTVSKELMWPYFNSGVIGWKNAQEFPTLWLNVCKKIDSIKKIDNKRPWLDQIGLPITMAYLKAEYTLLPERWNFPAHAKTLPADMPTLVHYHRPEIIAREPRMVSIVEKLSRSIPALRTRLEASNQWRSILTMSNSPARKTFRTQEGPDFLVTGIPRSGTSLLSSILNDQIDCVVLNEPAEIFAPFMSKDLPHGFLTVHADYRRDISLGEEISNKVENKGRLITDTAESDTRISYCPNVNRQSFLLGSKNTLAYLSRLSDIRAVLPRAPIIACIRNPVDTIYSWSRTFEHLRNADVASLVIGGTSDRRLDRWQQDEIERIAAQDNTMVKRALLWRYLAEQILRFKDNLLLIRYEDLAANPTLELTRIWSVIGSSEPILKEGIVARTRDVLLTSQEKNIIVDICGDTAEKFSYSISALD